MDQNGTRDTKCDKYPLFPSTRCSVYLMLFFASTLQYAGRFALNMSIVCMVVPAQQRNVNSSVDDDFYSSNSSLTSSCEQRPGTKKDFGFEGEFYWSRAQVGYILAALFYAYIPMQILAGWLADKFGIRHVLGTGILIGGIMNLLTPLAARLHYGLLIALRLVMGFALGVMFPCTHSFVGKWVPQSERITYVGFVFSGPSAGTIIAFLLSGFLCQFSWTIVFYLLGGVTVLWYVCYLRIVYNIPDEHPRISNEEKHYIKTSNRLATKAARKPARIPWRSMLASRSVLGMCVAQFASGWLYYTLGTGLPLYLQDVMYFNIKDNGVLSALPNITTLSCSVIFGVLCDVIHRRIITSRRILRKLSETLFAVITMVCIISVSFMKCDQKKEAVLIMCIIYMSLCFKRGGMSCGPSDVAPQMAGLVYGVVNFVGNFPGFLAPIAIGNLTRNGTQAEWQIVFSLSAGMVAVGWLSYLFLVGSDEEPWARQEIFTDIKGVGEENELEITLNPAKETKNEENDV